MHSILDLIGKTPLVRIQNSTNTSEIKVYAKLEGQNPGGSVKDRTAYGMISGAFEDGKLDKGDHIVEATSGNTGIALAMIARQFDLGITLIMPENSTKERIQTMKAYGAEVILTPAEKTIEYSRTLAEELSEEKGYVLLNQFANPHNYGIHVKTTGPEIWKDTNGQITHFVSSMGTTGTIMGVSRYIKSQNSKTKIIGVQPTDGSSIPGIRRWSPEFLPAIYEPERVDQIIDVSKDEAIAGMLELSRDYSIFAGMSSGGAFAAVKKLTAHLPSSSTVVFIVCDRGDRYLSSGIYDQ
ncbi:cysteine synthase CysM [Membranihabitans maritimus]|uniref:cysteine synthase CysM n=1 Tax=Membranihabitans maritimus TaxID=2904244 RepID=UPI001EFF6F82|nr:cysteine synthase CysM [Membranihabitans maritimus]